MWLKWCHVTHILLWTAHLLFFFLHLVSHHHHIVSATALIHRTARLSISSMSSLLSQPIAGYTLRTVIFYSTPSETPDIGSIPAVSARRGTLPSACCVSIRRESGGKPLASCKWVTDVSLETGYLVLLFLILQNDDNKDARIRRAHQRRVWMHDTLHWETEWCRRILHTCARTMGPTAITTDFRICQNFSTKPLAYICLRVSGMASIKTKAPIGQQHVVWRAVSWAIGRGTARASRKNK